MASDDYEIGMRIRREVLGDAYVDRAMDAITDFDRPFQEFLTDICWGKTWGREGLSRQQRSLNNLCILAVLNRQQEFALHFRAAIGNGCSLDEIRETLIQIATYAGVPAGVEAFRIGKQVLKELAEAESKAQS
ncbi:4-carboxymuconolactone decarboxylase [bacterium SCGC AG-212-C10]|nr:4-carboxymuconolactone decarboxylase [bacterium SCGC AG-212-C10]